MLYAEPNTILRDLELIPDDLDDRQWALNNTGQPPANGTNDADVDGPDAWDITTGSSNVTIAILDSGIPMQNGQLSHPDLDDPNKMILGPDFIDPFQQDGVRDDRGHGTHVAGIAGAESNNGIGIAGVCWSCRLMIIQVTDANGFGIPDAFYDGVVWAVDNTPSSDRLVINASLGDDDDHQRYRQAIEYAQANNALLVASAGNAGGGAVLYPAAHAPDYDNLVAVSSTDHNDDFSTFSSSGIEVSLAAPGGFGLEVDGTVVRWNGGAVTGTNIFSTTPNYPFTLQFDPDEPGDPFTSDITEDYGYLSGTSMAAPYVAGTAGLMLSADGSLSPNTIKNRLRNAADKVPGMNGQWETDEYGAGRVNAYNVLQLEAGIQGLTLFNPGSTGYWDAFVTGGIVPYSYNWYRSYNSFLGPWTWVGAGSDYSQTVEQEMYLKLNVSDSGSQTAQDIVHIRVNEDCGEQTCEEPEVVPAGSPRVAESLPETFGLDPNYPNPFNPATTIRYALPERAEVTLEVFNLMGRRVATLVDETQPPRFYRVRFDGAGLASGMYIARLRAVGESGRTFGRVLTMQLIK